MGPASGLDPSTQSFIYGLYNSEYSGEVDSSDATTRTAATDNSIYEVQPIAVLFPRKVEDLPVIMKAAAGAGIAVTMRGGGTGTNGQSLNGTVIVDCSRHLTRITDLDLDANTVVVEPGVVVEQLNSFLSGYGREFPIVISTSSRATIGGMVSTDAAGKGSRACGRTSTHLEGLELVMSDGSEWQATKMRLADAEAVARRDTLVGRAHGEALRVARDNRELIEEVFPRAPRSLVGYNLKGIVEAETFSLVPVVAGSEGTLALVKRARLKISRKPAKKALVVILYQEFGAALEHVSTLAGLKPTAIETIDDKILAAARTDKSWSEIGPVFQNMPADQARAINFIEVTAAGDDEMREKLKDVTLVLAGREKSSWKALEEPELVAQLWKMRERAVGLLAKPRDGMQGTAFVEDTAVPPDVMPAYIRRFREILDKHGLSYGMFGHADVGCLHVRPLLDMRLPGHAALIRKVSDEVALLVREFGGTFWGEHGRGFRSEYGPMFFGTKLFEELGRLKQAFDPGNLLNPGKIVDPGTGAALPRIDQVPFRGELDRAIPGKLQQSFDGAVLCNGNGACHSWNPSQAMCPSYRVTRDRVQSPQGRSILIRSWLRAQGAGGLGSLGWARRRSTERDVFKSLDTCLSCKACASECPVNVDVPKMKSLFLEKYYARRWRPMQHFLLQKMESILPFISRFPRLANLATHNPASPLVLRALFGLVDLPPASPYCLETTKKERNGSVQLQVVGDTYTEAFDGKAVEGVVKLLEFLGYGVSYVRSKPNGKALYVIGLRNAFKKIAVERVAALSSGKSAVDGALLGVDAATSLLHELEYREACPDSAVKVLGVEQFLSDEIGRGRIAATGASEVREPVHLFLHCTEKTQRPDTARRWETVFSHFGLDLMVVPTGCCGMAGLFGHDAAHLEMSRDIFRNNWAPRLPPGRDRVIASGFSCRCQVKRFAGFRPRHPAEFLLEHLTAKTALEA